MQVIDLTGEEIFAALQRDPMFIGEVPESARGVWRELCDEVPTVLADLLEREVTVEVFMNAKMLFLQHLLDNDWMQRMVRAYPEEALGGFNFEGILEMLLPALRGMIEMIPDIVGDVPSWLEVQGITEEQFLVHPSGGKFGTQTLVLWREGGFTLEELLRTQPMTIFKNTD